MKIYKIIATINKIMITSIAILLVAVLCMSIIEASPPAPPSPPTPLEYLIADGTSQYKIVVSKDAPYTERYAADELRAFLYKSTGAEIETITDEDLSLDADSKYLSVGETNLVKKANIATTASQLGQNGFIVKSYHKSVFMKGGGEQGTLYSVYEFLNRTVGFEVYAADFIYTDKHAKVLFQEIDITDKPDFEWREPNGFARRNDVLALRMRYSPNVCMGGFHNSIDEYFPESKYLSSHPEYYYLESGVPRQLCYTAHGNLASLEDMREIVLKRLKDFVLNNYTIFGRELQLISFTQEDYPYWCRCTGCTDLHNQYGTDSASLIRFINPVAEKFHEWLKNTFPDATIYIVIFAYQKNTKEAPVKEVNGGYVAIDPTVIPHESVAICYVAYYADYQYPLEATINEKPYEEIKGWASISDNLMFWIYSSNFFDNYFHWFDVFNSMQPFYQTTKNFGDIFLFNEARSTRGVTGFDTLKLYLSSKLAWDVDADVEKLTNSFFDKYFNSASEAMRDYLNSFRAHMEHLRETVLTNYWGILTVSSGVYTSEHLPKERLTQWAGYIQTAYNAIEQYKDNVQLYNNIYGRITKESIVIRYYLIELHSTTYPTDTLLTMKKEFKEDALKYGFDTWRGTQSISDLFSKWGV